MVFIIQVQYYQCLKHYTYCAPYFELQLGVRNGSSIPLPRSINHKAIIAYQLLRLMIMVNLITRGLKGAVYNSLIDLYPLGLDDSPPPIGILLT